MNLRTYALSVSLAAIIGLLATIAPLLRSVLEYRSPDSVDPQAELTSLEAFVSAKEKDEWKVSLMFRDRDNWNARFGERWRVMYDAAKMQQIQAVRSRARNNLLAYGTLCALCAGLPASHLLWARRARSE